MSNEKKRSKSVITSSLRKSVITRLCANYIKALLEDKDLDVAAEVEKLKGTTGAKFFDPTQNDVFPKSDFFMCTEVDKFDFVMRLEAGNNIQHMKKHCP